MAGRRSIGVLQPSEQLRGRLSEAVARLENTGVLVELDDEQGAGESCAVGVLAGPEWEASLGSLSRRIPNARWLIAAAGDAPTLRARASSGGAHGLCAPDAPAEDWADALSRVLSGATAWPAGSDAPASGVGRELGLTPRQLEVLDLVSRGLTNGEVGRALGIATATAKAHVAAVIAALDVSNRLEAAVAYREAVAESEDSAIAPALDAHPRVAVLAFADQSPERDHEFFADGVAEEIIAGLSRIPGLRVAARTSSFAFKGQALPAIQIASELGVDLLVEGSVRRQGDSLRVSASLVSGADGFPLWSESYARELRDVFAVQDDIAKAVVEALRIELSAEERARISVAHSADPEACDLYWRARYFWNQRTPSDVLRAVQYFQGAIGRDENYGLAHVGLADAYNQIGAYATVRPVEIFPKARAAAERALALAPELGEAHAALGYVKLVHDYDLEGAEECFEHALECNPSYPFAHGWAALPAAFRHRFENALERSRRGQALDPLSVHFGAHVGHMHYLAGELDEATAALERAIEMDDRHSRAWSWLALVHSAADRHDQAVACFEKGFEYSDGHPLIALGMGYVLARAGRAEEARTLDEAYAKRAQTEYVSPVYRSYVPIGLGDFDTAFAYLEQAFEDRAPILMYLGVEPLFASIRSDPRYASLSERIGLPA